MSENTPIDENEQSSVRLTKLNELLENNINPYPNRFNRTHKIPYILDNYFISDEEAKEGVLMTAGRVTAKRPMGKAAFFTIQDEEGSLQLYSNNKLLSPKDYIVLQNIDIGDIVGVSGEAFYTKTHEPSLRVKKLTMLAKNLSPLPVVKEKDGKIFDAFKDVETRYRKRYLDLAVNKQVREDFKIRSKIISEIRNFLAQRGYMEVETPMMQAIASGAAARPFETYHNTLDMPLFLRIAPELYLKRLIVGGFEKVFELNRNFRNEGISTKHNPEFTMMELYAAYSDYNDMMKITEELFEHIANVVIGSCKIPYGDEIIDVSAPWKRKPYLELIKEMSGADFAPYLGDENPEVKFAYIEAEKTGINTKHLKTFWEVVDEVFSEKVEPNLIQPIFVTDFPKAISPLAKEKPDNLALVERFEPYVAGREMGNAFSELNDPIDQEKRFRGQLEQRESGAEEVIEMDEDYIEALKVGMPPAGGLGIGIDRLIMLFTNKQSIKDVILFPQLRKKGSN